MLDYLDYDKQAAKHLLIDRFGWEDYGGKHYESMFTKFYQAYILPEKFRIDKRKAHLSTLICSGQLTKEGALRELEQPLYSPSELAADKEYVLKKLGLSETEFMAIMKLPVRRHQEFKTDTRLKASYMNLLVRTAPVRNKIRKIFSR
jgi:hypothetical protein